MTTVDDYYNAVGKSFYDWEGLYVQLDCSYSDLSFFDELSDMPLNDPKYTIVFLHEYIHFLQNFSTNWGVPLFTDLAFSYLQIGASSVQSTEDILIPLDLDEIKNELLTQGFRLREQSINKLNRDNKVINRPSGPTLFPISLTFKDNRVAVLSNGSLDVHVGPKVIREHMARYGSYLFTYTEDAILHEQNKNISKLDTNDYSKSPEYWILFEYFYQSGLLTNIGKGCFLLTTYCLATLDPVLIIAKFLKYVSDFHQRYRVTLNLDELVVTYFSRIENKTIIQENKKRVENHCDNLLTILDKHKGNHHLMQFIFNIINYSLENINYSFGGFTLFDKSMPYTDINFWRTKIRQFGSGLIHFRDGDKIYGGEHYVATMKDSYTFLLSVSLMIKKIVKPSLMECPFLYNFPICKASMRDSDDCIQNPFNMVHVPDLTGGLCLFGNAVALLALTDRIKRRPNP